MTVSSLPSKEVPRSLCPPEVKSTSFQNWLSLWGLAFPYVENGLMRTSVFCSSMSFLSVKGQVVEDVRRPSLQLSSLGLGPRATQKQQACFTHR